MMKKRIRSILALVLALLITVSCGSAAFAATAKTVRQYGKEGGYLAIGDSISRGCGAEGFYIGKDGEYLPKGEGQYGAYELRNVQGCVPYQIAQAVGCTAPMDMADQNATYWPFTFPGMTTAVTLDLLGIEDDFTDTKLNYAYYKDMLEYFGYEGSFDGVREGDVYDPQTDGKCGNIIELIEKADLITVQLGMCDIFYRAYRIISNGGMLANGLKFDLSSTDAIKKLVTTAISEMKFGYDYWKTHYPMLLDKIQELNPDATVVMVGAFNVVNQLTITDDTLAPVGSVVTAITAGMNRYVRQWEKEYNVLYADVTNTETQAAENDWSILGDFKDNTFTGTHPTQRGYDYMVRQILDLLPEKAEKTGISVDLGRFDRVDYVVVDGRKIKNYSMDGFTLNIPYSSHLAKNLTIGVKNGDGTVSVQIYQLVYKAKEGYTAYRIYGNNDIAGALLKPLRLLVKLFRMLFEKIGGLFNKSKA